MGARNSLATRRHQSDRGIHGLTPPPLQVTRIGSRLKAIKHVNSISLPSTEMKAAIVQNKLNGGGPIKRYLIPDVGSGLYFVVRAARLQTSADPLHQAKKSPL
jgi:hypothetical protein